MPSHTAPGQGKGSLQRRNGKKRAVDQTDRHFLGETRRILGMQTRVTRPRTEPWRSARALEAQVRMALRTWPATSGNGYATTTTATRIRQEKTPWGPQRDGSACF